MFTTLIMHDKSTEALLYFVIFLQILRTAWCFTVHLKDLIHALFDNGKEGTSVIKWWDKISLQ